MSSHGKGGKGLGKGGEKRYRKVQHNTIQGITKPTISHPMRGGNVKCINSLIYEEKRGVLKFLFIISLWK